MKKSGYGCQVALIAPRLIAAGHEVVVYGLEYVGESLVYGGVQVIGGNGDWTGGRVPILARRLKADLIITLKDLHALAAPDLSQSPIPWCPIVPVTTEPFSVVERSILRTAPFPLAMAPNGQRLMREAGFNALLTPLAYDPAVFSPGDKQAARQRLGWPEQAFVALFVGANQTNPSRKGLDQLLLAWSSFLSWKPEHADSLLMLHTDFSSSQGGLDLYALRSVLGLGVENCRTSEQLTYASGGQPAEYLADLYRAADVLINPATGGGFELALLEAQACGCPAIAPDWTAMRDMVWGGWKIATQGQAGGEPLWNDLGGFRFRPTVKALVQCLGEAFTHRDDPTFSAQAQAGAASYAVDHVIDAYWLPALRTLGEAIQKANLTLDVRAIPAPEDKEHPAVPLCKLCELEDFTRLADDFHAVYPHKSVDGWPQGQEHRKEWEVVQAVRGLQAGGAVHSRARILGVGAATEFTAFWLSERVEQVFVTDLYLGDGGWPGWAEPDMLKSISPWAGGGAHNPTRIVVQHMDGRKLNYPANFFDGLFSSSSIEHFGGWQDVEQAAREMGRVLKPGGILTLTTEAAVPGNVGEGFDNVLVLNAERVQRHIIEPSGCTLIEPISWDFSAASQETAQTLEKVAEAAKRGDPSAPHVVVLQGEHRFTSLSLVLRKPR